MEIGLENLYIDVNSLLALNFVGLYFRVLRD